ncbi:MAG TPA: bacillithiol biosynthesis cysteine-adding enzyme BshC [Candidatus Acidoferrales bacterium]|jgi:bacillithiol biosynthesis cysteine-adding enzyme BshC|nr:bacillithiol biosynthesis cysteine-adding enzyme BshC [Candidatus Acidoferrales bacterium]
MTSQNPQTDSHCISFREVPHTTKLFSSFLEDFGQVSKYYAHPPTAAGIDAAAREVRLDHGVRKAVVEVLREQNARLAPGAAIDPVTASNLDRLAAGAVAIVTGQQVGLFSGPAYTFYKAISAVRVAEETTKRGIDAVPIFWLATEDHDLAEVNHSAWVTRNGLARYDLPARDEDTGKRVGEVALGESMQALVGVAAQTLQGPAAEDVSRALHESYAPSETYGSAFGKLLARLLAGRGIIFIDPLDVRFHRIIAPVFLRALDEAGALTDALLARSKELESAGLHAQVKVTRETTLIFHNIYGRREPLRSRSGKFFAGDTELSREQIAATIESHPDLITPNALLRPVMQDSLLPTAAYIGGPAEVAYFAQSQVAYAKILGRMPAVLPRASFTIVEQPIARFLAQYGLEVRDFLRGSQHIRTQMEQKALPDVLVARFDKGEEEISALLKSYREPLGRLDATLLEALEVAERKMLYQFSQLKAKVARAENFRSGVLDRHEKILLDALYPNGELQERTLSALPFIAAYGPAFLDDLAALASVAGAESARSCVYQHHVLFL